MVWDRQSRRGILRDDASGGELVTEFTTGKACFEARITRELVIG